MPRDRDGAFLIEPETLANDSARETSSSVPQDTRTKVSAKVREAANRREDEAPKPTEKPAKKGRRRRNKPQGKTLDQYTHSELLAEVWRRAEAEGPPKAIRTEAGVGAEIVLKGITVRRKDGKYATEEDYQVVMSEVRRKEW